ncbi:MAG: hypothetical protein GY853_09800 [PVC group bacterium]|nr:hypothetical protein [PVC group bacterium]
MRYKVMTILDETDNVILYDPSSINWNDFDFSNGYYKHQVSSAELVKLYLVAYAYYGDVDYEDIILLLNKIEYVWDIVPETELKLPKKDDIDNFILDNIK